MIYIEHNSDKTLSPFMLLIYAAWLPGSSWPQKNPKPTKTQNKTSISIILQFRACWDIPVPEVSDSLGNFIFPLCYSLQVTASGTQAGSRRNPPPDTPGEVSGAPGGKNCSGHNRMMKSIHFCRIKSGHMVFLHRKYTEFQPTWLYSRQNFLIMEMGNKSKPWLAKVLRTGYYTWNDPNLVKLGKGSAGFFPQLRSFALSNLTASIFGIPLNS